ncbi:fibronectin type III domain-containing protein [Diaphorobacter sp. HDW4B]|uniref:fibronectin type III domain-containing protein n=1 Tax=Diaphorobacter sp. HDW4B TaxID=2714925 RepID=UPI00140B8E11|nr:fibronectin type III domain-containing protein [Diaphorobacter sp. HDW4B]QIL70444.1 fibronectin type III domain-containing protein [Diaphorobacter sp. HDW4B]
MKSLKHLSAAAFAGLCLPLSLWMGSASAAELMVNGDFEQNAGAGTQVFTGWQSQSQAGSQGGFYAQQGTMSAITPVTVPAPPQGTFAVMSDQPGPGSHVLYQDITIPAGQSATFTAKVFVQNAVPLAAAPASLDYLGALPNQQVRIDVITTAAALDDVGAGVLTSVFQWPPAGSTGPATTGGSYQNVQTDLSSLAGQTVRLRIAEVDNRQSLFFGVDAVSVQTSGAPIGSLTAPTNLTYVLTGSTAALSFSPVPSAPGQTVTGYTAQCTPQGGGAATSGSGVNPPVNMTGLAAGVAYDCKVAATTSSGTGPYSSNVSFTMPTVGAGTTVIPLPSGGGSAAVTLAGAGGGSTTCTVQTGSFIAAQNASVLPPQGAAAFPFGLLNIRATGCVAGSAVKINVVMPQAIPATAQYWKYGPTPGNTSPHWYAFAGFSFVGNVMTLTIQDGTEGDSDLIADGNITDPGGIMVPTNATASATPVPVGSWEGLLATSLAMWMGVAVVRRKRRMKP